MDEVLLHKKEEKVWAIITWEVFIEELKKVSFIAAPLMAVAVSQYLLQVISLMMAGHLGELALSGVAIATSFCNVTGFSLLIGFASALETLCGQAYGAMQHQKVASYTYCAIICILPICLPICFIWIFMDKILVLIGQDPQTAMVASKYSIWLIPALFAYAILQSQVRYFQSQSLIFPVLSISLSVLCIHVPVCWILVFKSGLETRGAALAIGLSYWFNVILLGIYMRYSSSCEKTRVLILDDVFSSIKEFFHFGIPSSVMVCLEWWSFEILVLLSGLLPNSTLETSVLSICCYRDGIYSSCFQFTASTIFLHYNIPAGISAAASTRVSNELGAGNPQAAQIASITVMVLTLAESCLAGSILFCFGRVYGYAYSNDEDIVNYVTKMIPLVCLSIVMDSLHAVLSGVIRGIGWQHIGAYANLGAYYLVGIPVGVLCGFVFHLRGKGLWVGIVAGSSSQDILLALLAAFKNWKIQAIKTRERIFQGSIGNESI